MAVDSKLEDRHTRVRTVCMALMAVSERMPEFHSDITNYSIYERALALEEGQYLS